jgi:hypothetical protein
MYGWPYVVILEDDAQPEKAWSRLMPRILSTVNERHGDVGWINLAPTFLKDPLVPAPWPLLFRVQEFLATQSVIYGRRMIPAAAAFLRRKVAIELQGERAAPHDHAFGVHHVGIAPPDLLCAAEVLTTQRSSRSDIKAVAGGQPPDYAYLWRISRNKLHLASKWWAARLDTLTTVGGTELPP